MFSPLEQSLSIPFGFIPFCVCGFFLLDCVLLIIYTQLSSNRLISRNWNPRQKKAKKSQIATRAFEGEYKRAGATSRAWIERERERKTGSPPNLTQLKREPRKQGAVAWLAILYICDVLLSDGRALARSPIDDESTTPPGDGETKQGEPDYSTKQNSATFFLFEEKKKRNKMGRIVQSPQYT